MKLNTLLWVKKFYLNNKSTRRSLVKYIIINLMVLLMFSACTKNEFKDNWNNVKEGVKTDWKSVKKNVAETTEDYKEH